MPENSNRCEIIAEAGINHNGEMIIAKRLIELAKECGADVFKTQLYDPEKLLDKSLFSSDDWFYILRSKLSFQQTKELKEHCDKVEIEFMASAFDLERLGWLERLNVKRHKIASRSIYDFDYVEAIKATGKPYIVSMGMINDTIVPEYKTFTKLGFDKFLKEFASPLYCVSKYPTKLSDINFENQTFVDDYYYGFSDHTIGLTASKVAISLGAKIIEKHFTLYRNFPGPDQACSIVPKELRELCKFRDEVSEMNIEYY